MKTDGNDLFITINGVEYSAPVVSRIEKILSLMVTIISSNGGSGGNVTDVSALTPEQMQTLIDLINNGNQSVTGGN